MPLYLWSYLGKFNGQEIESITGRETMKLKIIAFVCIGFLGITSISADIHHQEQEALQIIKSLSVEQRIQLVDDFLKNDINLAQEKNEFWYELSLIGLSTVTSFSAVWASIICLMMCFPGKNKCKNIVEDS